MAETTLDPTTETPPASTDNGDPGGHDPGPDAGGSSSTATPDAPLWERMGYKTPDELEQTHKRYREQNDGSRAESLRLQRELQAERDRNTQFAQALLARQAAPAATDPNAAPAYRNQQEAYEAYLGGQQDALVTYEQQARQQQQQAVQQAVQQELQTRTLPAQYTQMVMASYPEMDKADSPLAQAAMAIYDRVATENRLMFPDQPLALINYPLTDGGSKRVDLRVLRLAAAEAAKDLAKEAGRREEAARRSATGGGPTGTRGRATAPEPSDWEQLTDADRRGIDDMVSKNITPKGWPVVADHSKRKQAFAKHIMGNRRKREATA